MIEIMKASAGSGKTFNLAKNYIHLLLQKKNQPDTYRHILAVTFTNKATEEMKSRILRELYILAKDPLSSGFRNFFVPGALQMDNPAVCKDNDDLKDAAARCLNAILHDYSAFSVSTIDKFFQRTLKSFAREIGQFASYRIELDRDSMITESVDRVLDSITSDSKELLEWLTEGAMDDLSEGKKYNMEKRLFGTASRLKHFSHRELVEKLGIDEAQAYSKDNIRSIENLCRKITSDFAEAVRNTSRAIIGKIDALGYGENDFRRYFYSGIAGLKDFKSGDKFSVSATLLNCLTGEIELFTKSDKNANAKKTAIGESLDQEFADLASSAQNLSEVYNTALNIMSSLHDLGVASELYREFDALSKEKNIMSLAESDAILKGIINGSDTPFIYEKLGVRLENFLLDEFQDTSRLQWENLWPLLRDSQTHASYHQSTEDSEIEPYSLVVGDVKQSIYRWRGSEWGLLNNEVEDNFRNENVNINNVDLQDNYRSLPSIVEFNNGFFPFMAKNLDARLGNNKNIISGIYSTTHQNCKSSENQRGSVDITLAEDENLLSCVVNSINEVLANGGTYGDVAVLVRTNGLGSEIAGHLIENSIPVVTSDSLSVKNSSVVRRTVAYLALMDNPEDKVAQYIAGNAVPVPDYCHSIIDWCEFYLRIIDKSSPGIIARHTLYVQSFLDIVKDYVADNGNNLKGFLEEWADNKSYIASPEGGNAVNVITIHKAKGLEFPYVIYLYKPGKNELSIRGSEKFWCAPDSKGTELEKLGNQVFDVHLSKLSEQTMFRKDYYSELEKLYVDIINVAYVAFTRPAKGLHIITEKSKSESLSYYLENYANSDGSLFKSVDTEDNTERYRLGEPYIFRHGETQQKSKTNLPSMNITTVLSSFVSFPLNGGNADDKQEAAPSRLRIKTDSYDFFAEDGSVGIEASVRRKGTVLHKILSSVNGEGDIEGAVEEALRAGDLTEAQAKEAGEFLRGAIGSVKEYNWFSEDISVVRNEASLIDTSGHIYRPDRIIETDGRITVVDYKFGVRENSHRKQVKKYADLYAGLGYKEVEAYLWYISSDDSTVDKVV